MGRSVQSRDQSATGRAASRCSRWAAASLAAAAVAAIGGGCQKGASVNTATVQGSVTIDGELATSGMVTFYPVAGGPAAVGEIHADGSYALRVGQGRMNDPDASKIPAGEYVATAMVTGPPPEDAAVGEGGPPKVGPRLVALKYTTRETSDLKYAVAAGANIINLPLLGTSADPPEADEPDDGDEPSDDAAEEASADDDSKVGEDAPPASEDDAEGQP